MSSAPGVPPGSRVVATVTPCASRRAARRRSWVLLPLPSPPSKLMNLPGTRPQPPNTCLSAAIMRPNGPAFSTVSAATSGTR